MLALGPSLMILPGRHIVHERDAVDLALDVLDDRGRGLRQSGGRKTERADTSADQAFHGSSHPIRPILAGPRLGPMLSSGASRQCDRNHSWLLVHSEQEQVQTCAGEKQKPQQAICRMDHVRRPGRAQATGPRPQGSRRTLYNRRERGFGLLIRRRLLTGGDFHDLVPARQEGLDAGRVELPALVLDQIVSRHVAAASALYMAGACQGIEDVGDRDDARGDRDLVSPEGRRIARAVPTLVMACGNLRTELDQLAAAVARIFCRSSHGCGSPPSLRR